MTTLTRPALAILLLFPMTGAHADDQIRRVQEELRKRNLYFGEVDGRRTEETVSAIKRYQARRGLEISGNLDSTVLRSLDLPASTVASGAPKADWPEMPVLRSDSAREIQESDRKYLEELDQPPSPIAEPPEEEQKADGLPTPPNPPSGVANTVGAEVTPENPEEKLSPPRVEAFVQRYLEACEKNNVESEMRFYSEPLDYFDQGKVQRQFVQKDVERFYKRWPQRGYKLLSFRLQKNDNGDAKALFKIGFDYREKGRNVTGQTVNSFGVSENPAGELIFTSLKEQRIPRDR